MSRYHGPQPGYKGAHGKTKGVMKTHRELKREEAEERQKDYNRKVAQCLTQQETVTSAEDLTN